MPPVIKRWSSSVPSSNSWLPTEATTLHFGCIQRSKLPSLLSGRPVKHTVGMTGEVTLQGRVLPIGGLKQKALAAHAAGITDVIIPERNRGDLDDVPEDVRGQLRFHPVESVDEVLALALEAPVAASAAA